MRGEARVWNVADGTPSSFTMKHESEIQALAFSPDGRTILTGSSDMTARLWDAATGRPLSPPLKHERVVHTVAFSSDGKLALTADQDVDPALGRGHREVPRPAAAASGRWTGHGPRVPPRRPGRPGRL